MEIDDYGSKFTIAKYVFYGELNQVALSRANIGYRRGDILGRFELFLDFMNKLLVVSDQ